MANSPQLTEATADEIRAMVETALKSDSVNVRVEAMTEIVPQSWKGYSNWVQRRHTGQMVMTISWVRNG